MGLFDKVRKFQEKTDPLNAQLENIVFGPPSQGNGEFSGGPGSFSIAPPTPDPLQTLIDPTEMPSVTSSQSRTAKRRSYAQQLARMGRMSTILSQPDDTLG